jgi:hypothetical protein
MGGFDQSQFSNGSQSLDPATQAYVDAQRGLATQGANAIQNTGPLFQGPNQYMQQALNALSMPGGGGGGNVFATNFGMGPSAEQIQKYMNPYTQSVVDPTRAEFDYLRGQASTDAKQAATMQGAFGGSRAALTEGARLGALDRARATTPH